MARTWPGRALLSPPATTPDNPPEPKPSPRASPATPRPSGLPIPAIRARSWRPPVLTLLVTGALAVVSLQLAAILASDGGFLPTSSPMGTDASIFRPSPGLVPGSSSASLGSGSAYPTPDPWAPTMAAVEQSQASALWALVEQGRVTAVPTYGPAPTSTPLAVSCLSPVPAMPCQWPTPTPYPTLTPTPYPVCTTYQSGQICTWPTPIPTQLPPPMSAGATSPNVGLSAGQPVPTATSPAESRSSPAPCSTVLPGIVNCLAEAAALTEADHATVAADVATARAMMGRPSSSVGTPVPSSKEG